MTLQLLRARRVVRHSRRFFLVLCAWCQGALGPVGSGAARRPCGCAWDEALLRQARARFPELGLPRGEGPPFPPPAPTRPRRAARSRASRLQRRAA